MPITLSREIERMERRLRAAMGARPRDTLEAIAALEAAVALIRRDSVAARWFSLVDLLGELADEYETAGRTDDALTAIKEAIAAGWVSQPDARCRIAEILLRAGRRDEADAIWLAVKVDTPDDVWLYHVAGLEYAFAGDHEAALGWLSDGLRIALNTGDPEQLVEQISQQRAVSLQRSGQPHDDLQARADAFIASAGDIRLPAQPGSATAGPTTPDGRLPGRNDACWCGSGRKFKNCCALAADASR